MKWSFANVGIIIFGLIGIFAIVFFTELTVSNEQDYYSLKDAAEAAMIESIDIAYYRLTGSIKMSQEKFVENFTRRFTKTSTYGQGNYSIQFYDISETPPKVSIRIVDATNEYNIFNTLSAEVDATKIDIINELSGILDVYSDGDNSMTMTPASLRQHIKDTEEKKDDDSIPDVSKPTIKPQIWGVNFIGGELIVTTDDGKQYVYEDNEEPEITDCYQLYDAIECDVAGGDAPIVMPIKKTTPVPEPTPNPNPDPEPDLDPTSTTPPSEYRFKLDVRSVIGFDRTVATKFLFFIVTHREVSRLIPKYSYFVYYNGNYYVSNDNNLSIENEVKCNTYGNKLQCIGIKKEKNKFDFVKLNNKNSLYCFQIETNSGIASQYYYPTSSLLAGESLGNNIVLLSDNTKILVNSASEIKKGNIYFVENIDWDYYSNLNCNFGSYSTSSTDASIYLGFKIYSNNYMYGLQDCRAKNRYLQIGKVNTAICG